MGLLAAIATTAVLSCTPPPGAAGPYRPAELSAEARAVGVLPIFITDQMTDGRNVKLRGKIRNPYPEPVAGVRLVYLDVAPGPPPRVLNHVLRILDVQIGSEQETQLRWDI